MLYYFFVGYFVCEVEVGGDGEVVKMWCYVWYEFYWYVEVVVGFFFVGVVGE